MKIHHKSILSLMALSFAFISCNDDETAPATAPVIAGNVALKNYPASGTITTRSFNANTIAIPTAGANLVFDYNAITLQLPVTSNGGLSPNPAFATATSSINTISNFLGSNQDVPTVNYYNANNTSQSFLGTKYNALNINFPGVGSVAFPQQNVASVPAYKLAEFPMTFNQSFSQSTSNTTNFSVNSPALPAPNVPARYIDVNTSLSVNIAWGTLKIPGYSQPMQALVQKVTESIKRNYFLMNASGGFDPMPAMLLGAVGLVDGEITNFTYYQYWVADKGNVLFVDNDGSGFVTLGL